MGIVYSRRFMRCLESAPPAVQRAFFKQLLFLEQNLHHPSLRAKKYDESIGLWQARVNRDWRFYFTIESHEYRLHEIKSHPK
jgi:plasmid maintenance system killer protein